MKRRSFFKVVGIIITALSVNLFADNKKVLKNIYLYNTDTLYKEVSNRLNISYDSYYKHLEYLYSTGMVSYPRTKAEKISPDYELNSNNIPKKDFKKLITRRQYAVDWDNTNSHLPLTSFITHKVDIKGPTIFTAEYSEFGGEDMQYEKERYGEELNHLNLIFSLVQNRTISFYSV